MSDYDQGEAFTGPDGGFKAGRSRAAKRAWKLANPELVKEQQRRYAARNKSRRRAYFRAYYQAKRAEARDTMSEELS